MIIINNNYCLLLFLLNHTDLMRRYVRLSLHKRIKQVCNDKELHSIVYGRECHNKITRYFLITQSKR